jgi:hypothetical protein
MRRRERGIGFAAVWTLISCVPSAVLGQDCEVDRSAGHADWHEAQRALEGYREELARILTDAGQPALGSLVIRRGPDGGTIDVRRLSLAVPSEAEAVFTGVLDRLVASPELASSSSISLDFGAPPVDLRPDQTETCGAEMDNVAEAGGLLAQVVAGAIQREGKANPAGRVRFELSLLVDWTGRVSEIEFREDPRGWEWIVPYLEALAPALRYRPATLNGTPRTMWVPEQFELEF